MDWLWAEAVLMASWWLLWAGWARATLERWRIPPGRALLTLAILWSVGWIQVPLVAGKVVADVGLVLGTILAGCVTARSGRRGLWLAWIVLGLLSAEVRALAPINPHQAEVVPWLTPEALALGLLAGAVAGEPLAAAACAVGATAVGSTWRLLVTLPHASLGGGVWLYAVLAGMTAWLVSYVFRGRILGAPTG